MRRFSNNVSIILIVAVLLGIYPSSANASADAGFEIEFGKFKLNVYYSTALLYDEDADKYIKDPRLALFALVALLQANRESFSAIDHKVEVELYKSSQMDGNLLSIIEDPQKERNVIRDGVVQGDVSKEIVKTICSKYSSACKQPAISKIILYRCLKGSCPGKVRFGTFPSVYGVNENFGLLPHPLTTERIKTTKNNMGKYYEMLE